LDQFQIDFIQFRGTIYPTAGLYQYTQAGYYNDNVNYFTTAGMTAVAPTNNIGSTLATLTTSYQYLGYFLASNTGVYRFGIASDDAGYLWIGSTGLSGYTANNAVIAQPGLRGAAYTYSRNYLLTAGTYYPIRFMTGNNGGAGGQFLQWSYNGGAFTNDGTGEYFYNSDVGVLVDELFTINVTNVGSTDYALSGTDRNGAVTGNDPAISFKVGSVVDFVVNATGHPFWVKTSAVTGTVNAVPDLTNGGAAVGTVRWNTSTVGTFYYICQIHSAMVGTITIVA
jgi:plastocyanin